MKSRLNGAIRASYSAGALDAALTISNTMPLLVNGVYMIPKGEVMEKILNEHNDKAQQYADSVTGDK